MKHEKLAHYASEAYDIEFEFESLGGFKEVEGVHARGDWDLSQHMKYSGQDLNYFDQTTGKKFIPHIMETSVGLNRLLFMFIENAYTEEELTNSKGEKETRTVLKIDKKLAPIKLAIFPLLKNRSEIVEKAKKIYDDLKEEFICEFDDNGNIGKRYRRQDEIGTPYCVTVDFETLKDDSVTLRDRDSMQQERVKISEVADYLKKVL